MSDPLPKRVMVRFGDDDIAWIDEQAADEGVDRATFVRMVVNRLRRGRPPLMRLALAAPETPAETEASIRPRRQWVEPMRFVEPVDYGDGVTSPPAADAGTVSALLEQRMAEAEALPPDPEPQVNGAAAVSLHHVPRTSYNPGRQ